MANETNSSGPREVPLNTCVIPENFVDTGRCFHGMFRTRNLIEGLVLAVPLARFIYLMDLTFSQKVVGIVVLAGGLLILFNMGINGDSVIEFLMHYCKFTKKKRVAKYNPRVKMEAKPGYLTKEQGELPRDKILRAIDAIHSRSESGEEAVSRDIYDPMYREFFEDDLGYVETPDDLKSKSQLRQEAKDRKRAEKKARKNKKAADKKSAAQAKKAKKAERREDKKNGKRKKG